MMQSTDDLPTPRRARRWWAILGRAVATVVSLSVLLASGWAWATFRSFSTAVTVVPFARPSVAAGPLTVNRSDENVLIVGDDSRAGATAAELADIGTDFSPGDNTDTIMVLHLPADGRSAALMSFPRDSIVPLPSGGTGKINSVYSLGGGDAGGGPTALATSVTAITGLAIDHFVKVGMLGFYRISKAVGGVDLNLCQAQNAATESDATHPQGYSGINLRQGWNYAVSGKQALAFVRQRHGPGLSDYTRVQRQRYFLGALFRKLGTPANLANPLTLERIVAAISSSLTVDEGLRGTKMLTLASQMQSLTAGRLALSTIPMVGEQTDGNGDYLGEQIDADAMPAFIARFVGQPTAYQQARPVDPATVTVTVFDGSRAAGSAATAASALAARGFQARVGQSAARVPSTVIRYPAGMQAQAKTLAAAVPGAAVVLTHTVTSLQLVLGTDRAHVLGQPVPAVPGAGTTDPNAGSHASATPPVSTAADAACVP